MGVGRSGTTDRELVRGKLVIETNIARDKVQYGRYCIATRVHGPGSVVEETGSWPVRRTGCGRELDTARVDALFLFLFVNEPIPLCIPCSQSHTAVDRSLRAPSASCGKCLKVYLPQCRSFAVVDRLSFGNSVGLGCLDLSVHSVRAQRVPKVSEPAMWCSLSMGLVPSCRSASVESAVHRSRAAEGRCAVVSVVVVWERFEARNAHRGKGHVV